MTEEGRSWGNLCEHAVFLCNLVSLLHWAVERKVNIKVGWIRQLYYYVFPLPESKLASFYSGLKITTIILRNEINFKEMLVMCQAESPAFPPWSLG